MNYEMMSLSELREAAKERKMKGVSTLRKHELMEAIKAFQRAVKLRVNGVLNQETVDALYAAETPTPTPAPSSTPDPTTAP